MRLVPGQKTPLSALNITTRMTVEVDYGLEDLDIVLFGLNRDKRIQDDKYTVLFSNPVSPGGAIRMRSASRTAGFDIDLAALPTSIERLMLVASHDGQPLSAAKPLAVTIGHASFDAGSTMGQERAAMLVEIYRHNGEWRIAAIGQGFSDGLAKLIEHLGGSVADEGPTTTPITTAEVRNNTSPPGVSLSKITLEKRKSVSLEKQGASFGDIILNLNWAQKRGGGIFGGGKSLDLDLGALYELKNGEKGVVQALGKTFGSYDRAPYMELDGDDRSGSAINGETIRINGKRFDQIKRIAVFALIYEGAVRWDQTDAKASIKIPDQPEVVVEIRDGNDRQRLYGMAVIENDGGDMRITNHARCYKDQKEFADEVGIYLNWRAGRK